MRFLLLLLLPLLLPACGGYEIKNLAKSDIDLVADEFITETRVAVRELVVKLYKRNPAQLKKNPGMTIEGRLAQLKVQRHELDFRELNGQQGINAMNMAFNPGFRGDRVFALVVGLGGMLREAYRYKAEMFLTDQLEPEVLLASARNVEVLLWKWKNTRKPDGEHYLSAHEYKGVVDNLALNGCSAESSSCRR